MQVKRELMIKALSDCGKLASKFGPPLTTQSLCSVIWSHLDLQKAKTEDLTTKDVLSEKWV
jgi:hypothetical protein